MSSRSSLSKSVVYFEGVWIFRSGCLVEINSDTPKVNPKNVDYFGLAIDPGKPCLRFQYLTNFVDPFSANYK